jgi:transcription elongation factor Elf1
MGRRKTAQKKIKKKKPGVSTQFKCLFCNHENAVECKLNHNVRQVLLLLVVFKQMANL